MKTILYTFAALVMSFSLAAQNNVNTQKSKVTFEIGNMIFKTVEGSFTGMTGTVVFEPSDLANASIDVCIDASTVNTDNEKRDDHLRDPDFFEVAKYPTICFKSTSITKTSNGYVAKGKLTMHGVTKTVSIPLTHTKGQLKGELTLLRKDYKVGESMSNMMVSDEVTINIICVFN